MIATAHVIFDRSYFELQYDEWLKHRSRLKRYEVWFALALILFGVTLAFLFRSQWIVGALFAAAGVYEFLMAATHKKRWVNARVSTNREGKTVDLKFFSDSLTSSSANGTATIGLSAFSAFTPATSGFFLIPETGLSIYVPRSAIDPSDSYSQLMKLLESTIASNRVNDR